jgi:hypothetical protein
MKLWPPLLAAFCLAPLATAQIKGGQWEVAATLEASGLELEIGSAMVAGPVLSTGEETVFAKWRDLSLTNSMVFSLYRSPSLFEVWTFETNISWDGSFSATVVPDFNQDGVDDILVGIHLDEGHLWLLDGAQGTSLWETQGPSGSNLGELVSVIQDVNSDGVADWMALASMEYAPTGGNRGRIYLYSGSDGSLIRILDPANPWSGTQAKFANAGDWDGDGYGDFFCSDRYSSLYAGEGIRVRSGLTGAILQSWVSPFLSPGSLLAISDADGDGKPEVVAGHHGDDSSNGATSAGIVRLYLSTGVGPEWESEGTKPNEFLGRKLTSIPDLDLDGFPDLVASGSAAKVAGQSETGLIRILSSKTGERIGRLVGEATFEHFGTSIVGLGTESEPILFVGSPDWNPPNGYQSEGRIQAFRLDRQFSATPDEISTSVGGSIHFEVDFPADYAGEFCFPIASRQGIDTTDLLGIKVSISPGPLFQMGITIGYPFLSVPAGTLDAQGDWQFDLNLPPTFRLTSAQDLYIAAFHTPPTFLPGEGAVSYPLRIRILP